MKKFYVIGSNSSKSLSPIIFNYWFSKYKIKALYKHLQLNNKNFDVKIKEILKDKDLIGLNITIPFKQKIMKHIDSLNKHSREINAVNCLTTGSKIKGTNTDWTGYFKTLPKNKNLKREKILIIGYGGAALAIHYVLRKKKFKNIIIFNRTKKKLRFEDETKYTKNMSDLHKYLNTARIIINTTPKNPISSKSKRLVSSKALLSDIVYRPKETNFLKMFPKNKKIYGISMLLEQAVPCFKIWFGFNPSVDPKLIKLLNNKIR